MASDDERSLLKHVEELTEENNELLHKLYRLEQWRRFMSIAYWVIIVGISLGAFYIFQPYIDTLRQLFGAGGTSPAAVIESLGTSGSD